MVEGSSQFRCHSFAAKMINGNSVGIEATGRVQTGAMYTAAANIVSGSDIDIGLLSGSLQVVLHLVCSACATVL